MTIRLFVMTAIFLASSAMGQEMITSANAMSRVVKKVAPEFPVAARQLNVTGFQEVQVTVNAEGDVEDVKVVKGNPMFTLASTAAVKQWKFTPLLKDGAPAKFMAVLTINYSK
jgi:periplasmic protein TonB